MNEKHQNLKIKHKPTIQSNHSIQACAMSVKHYVYAMTFAWVSLTYLL